MRQAATHLVEGHEHEDVGRAGCWPGIEAEDVVVLLQLDRKGVEVGEDEEKG